MRGDGGRIELVEPSAEQDGIGNDGESEAQHQRDDHRVAHMRVRKLDATLEPDTDQQGRSITPLQARVEN